jgi:division protein 1
MSSKFKGKSADRPDITRAALDPEPSTVHTKMDLVSKTLFAPFSNKKKDTSRILTDREQHAILFVSII